MLFLTRFRTYKIALPPPQTEITSGRILLVPCIQQCFAHSLPYPTPRKAPPMYSLVRELFHPPYRLGGIMKNLELK